MKKILALILVTVIILGAAAGCTKKEPSAAEIFGLDITQQVKLSVVGQLDNFEALEAVIAKFTTEYPNCTITYSTLDDYANNLVTHIKNEDGATSMFISGLDLFRKNEELYDLTLDMADATTNIDLSATNTGVTDSQKLDGKLYTLPLAMVVRGMVVNKTLLAEKGVAMPKNFTEFVSACETFKNAGLIPIQANNTYYAMGLMYPYFAINILNDPNGTNILNELNALTEGSGKYVEEVCTRLNTLVEKEYINFAETDGWKDNYDAAILNFFEGDVPFFPCTTEAVSGMKKRESKSESFSAKPFEYEFVCVPAGDDGGYCYWQSWQGISICKNSQNENWSRAFINFLLKEENLSLLGETKGMPANTNKATSDAKYASLYSVPADHTANSSLFQLACYSELNKAMASIVKPLDDAERNDAAGAVELFEELIAEKRNEE